MVDFIIGILVCNYNYPKLDDNLTENSIKTIYNHEINIDLFYTYVDKLLNDKSTLSPESKIYSMNLINNYQDHVHFMDFIIYVFI